MFRDLSREKSDFELLTRTSRTSSIPTRYTYQVALSVCLGILSTYSYHDPRNKVKYISLMFMV